MSRSVPVRQRLALGMVAAILVLGLSPGLVSGLKREPGAGGTCALNGKTIATWYQLSAAVVSAAMTWSLSGGATVPATVPVSPPKVRGKVWRSTPPGAVAVVLQWIATTGPIASGTIPCQ